MEGRKSISVIIPALNEADSIVQTVRAVPKKELENMGYKVQILVVDNGSEDGTGELARDAGADVVVEKRHGYGYAYKTGFANAKGDIIATADADLTYPIEDIPRMVETLGNEGLDFITTNRYAKMVDGAMSPVHRVGNQILNLTSRLLFHCKFKDSQSGMWIFRKNLLNKVILEANSMALSEEIKIEACYILKMHCKELPIVYRPRLGKVKLRTFRDGFGNLFFLIRKRLKR